MKLKRIFKFTLFIFLSFICFNLGMYIYCLLTPKIELSRNQSYYLYDNENNLIFNNYSWVSIDEINPYLINATISIEDKRFYYHFGFDYLRIIKAAIKNISTKQLAEGASTITQQYARNLFLNYDKTWSRKIKEAVLSFELESHYSKNEILEGYLNTINYGGVFGIENASKFYFNKTASDLTLAEAAMLAGIPQSPTNNSPLVNEDFAIERQHTILNLMLSNKFISKEEYNNAISTKLTYYGSNDTTITSGVLYFKDAVMNELSSIDSIPESVITTGGIKIYTTLDSNAQKILENEVNSHSYNNMQIAAIMMDPNNGAVLSLIGGTNYTESQYNRVIQSKRQVGSTMKPLLYYSALENGFTAASSFISEKTIFSFSDETNYSPKNYNDKYANGPLSMAAAIAYSDNVYAVKTHLFLGEDKLVNMANRLGITDKISSVPSLALGTEEISIFNMVQAYSSFANLGNKVSGHFITKIEDMNGNILYNYEYKKVSILNSSNVFILNEMLTYTYDVDFIDYNYPTLINLSPLITHKYSIKSGTTDTDSLIIGYNKNAVLGIWQGYDDNSKIDDNKYLFHKDIWINTMEKYLKNKEVSWYDIPSNVVGTIVNPITGDIATENDKKKKIFYFIKGTEPVSDSKYDLDAVFNEEKNSSN